MMKKLCYMLAVALAIVLCVGCDTEQGHLYDDGVSKELAQKRKETIKELVYDLHFTIPDSLGQAVNGRVAISFALDEADEVVVDFRQPAEKIHSVEVNGQSVEYFAVNEHIVVGSQWTVAGQNTIVIDFEAGDQSLNRNEEFMYTLLVPDRARTLFPCFDQPNLKAEYRLSLELPAEWEAVANSPLSDESIEGNRKLVKFSPTEPLSTYLFSFVVGKFEKAVYEDEKRKMIAYHRETDANRLSQLDEIFRQVVVSLEWLEEYTGIAYPFAKYDFVILPGFQYGGMEHTGATLYNDTRMFLSENPTEDEKLQRIQLIAHETAHMWFGDYVTMDWFDDVWTKEVFANYFAARITEPLYPDINHRLSWLKMTAAPSLNEDRTIGTTSIKQQLDNLQDAGLVYGNIIYCKSPIVLEKIIEIMGESAFQEGVREYLTTYAYGNATWDDLIAILDKRTDYDLKNFSRVWVNEKGMPNVDCMIKDDKLVVSQKDPYNRGLNWHQKFNVIAVTDEMKEIEIEIDADNVSIPLKGEVKALLPNSDGRGYGCFMIDDKSRRWLKENWSSLSEVCRLSLLMSLNENYWKSMIGDEEWLDFLLDALNRESDALIASSICSYLSEPMRCIADESVECRLFDMAQTHAITSCRLSLMRMLIANFKSQSLYQRFYDLWQNQSNPLLSETDYMSLSCELSIRKADLAEQIISTQRNRISNPDRLRQFDFLAMAVNPDKQKRDEFFKSLLEPENRSVEPWTATALSYLNHPAYQPSSLSYIRPGLEELLEVQRTGDIFFPRNWVGSLLGNYRNEESRLEVEKFLEENPDYKPLLKNKILQAASPMYRKQ